MLVLLVRLVALVPLLPLVRRTLAVWALLMLLLRLRRRHRFVAGNVVQQKVEITRLPGAPVPNAVAEILVMLSGSVADVTVWVVRRLPLAMFVVLPVRLPFILARPLPLILRLRLPLPHPSPLLFVPALTLGLALRHPVVRQAMLES